MKRWISALALMLGLAGAAVANPVGMVTHLTGKAEVRSASGGDWEPLRLMTKLEAGDSVRCAAGGEAIITVFASAEQCTVAAGTTVTLDARGVQGAKKIAGLHGSGIQVARAMAGDRPNGFFARPAQSHQRLQATYPGWILEGERVFSWEPTPRAATYTFSLFDQNDNVVWSQRVTEPKAAYPADLPYFSLRRAYVWRLVPFGESGKPLPDSRWGILTFLSKSDADQVSSEAKELEEQAKTEGDNVTSLILLAELYRSYGVLEKTLETLERPELENQSGIKEAQAETYGQISRYAQVLSIPVANAPAPIPKP